MTRININFDDELLKRVDDYAKKCGINRTAAISVLCGAQLEQKDALYVMTQIIAEMNKEK
jgi:metal-responsive CopG/Arc/MetJ family transcriptional regulator